MSKFEIIIPEELVVMVGSKYERSFVMTMHHPILERKIEGESTVVTFSQPLFENWSTIQYSADGQLKTPEQRIIDLSNEIVDSVNGDLPSGQVYKTPRISYLEFYIYLPIVKLTESVPESLGMGDVIWSDISTHYKETNQEGDKVLLKLTSNIMPYSQAQFIKDLNDEGIEILLMNKAQIVKNEDI